MIMLEECFTKSFRRKFRLLTNDFEVIFFDVLQEVWLRSFWFAKRYGLDLFV